MKYIFCSLMFNEIEDDIKKSKNPNAISGHKFQENIICGLLANNAEVYVINTPRIRHFPDYPSIKIKPDNFLVNGKIVGQSIGFCNLFFVSYFSQYIQLKKTLTKILKQFNKEKCTILIFNSYLVQSMIALKLRKKYSNVKLCDVVGDLHGKYGILRENATLKEKLVDLYGRLEDYLAKKFDYFILLSKYMQEVIECDNSEYVVIEGMYNNQETIYYKHGKKDKSLLYAGSLDIEYDIEHLLRAFALTNDPDFSLFIAGNGNAKNLVKKFENIDHRIKYLGVLSPSDLAYYQIRVTALISPRKNNHNYVKYSFPSKTMECLALGKPYIAHKLTSEPEEYADYIQYAEETDEGLSRKITEVLMMSEEEREEIGRRSKEFIMSEKNPKNMCRKLISLCER